MSTNIPIYEFHSGNKIPLIGLGTDKITGKKLTKGVLDLALDAGYRAFDTAAMYGNEQDIGCALKELLPKYNLKREDIFITTKLLPSHHGDNAIDALKQSLNNLDCDYLDLYLIHWPGSYSVHSNSYKNATLRAASWASLVKAKEEGLVKDLGVSNYMPQHLTELLDNNYGVKPVLNQVEWHISCHPDDLKLLCDKENILLQAYMPLGGTGNTALLKDFFVLHLSEKLQKKPAQILLRWCLQQNVAVIPKARSKDHLEQNLKLDFVIPEEGMENLGKRKFKRYDWDPYTVK